MNKFDEIVKQITAIDREHLPQVLSNTDGAVQGVVFQVVNGVCNEEKVESLERNYSLVTYIAIYNNGEYAYGGIKQAQFTSRDGILDRVFGGNHPYKKEDVNYVVGIYIESGIRSNATDKFDNFMHFVEGVVQRAVPDDYGYKTDNKPISDRKLKEYATNSGTLVENFMTPINHTLVWAFGTFKNTLLPKHSDLAPNPDSTVATVPAPTDANIATFDAWVPTTGYRTKTIENARNQLNTIYFMGQPLYLRDLYHRPNRSYEILTEFMAHIGKTFKKGVGEGNSFYSIHNGPSRKVTTPVPSQNTASVVPPNPLQGRSAYNCDKILDLFKLQPSPKSKSEVYRLVTGYTTDANGPFCKFLDSMASQGKICITRVGQRTQLCSLPSTPQTTI